MVERQFDSFSGGISDLLAVDLAEQALAQYYYKQNRTQQLRGFYHVALTGSFSTAAERLCLGQPAVTLQVQALERELGVRLFDRRRGQAHLTLEGQLLFELASSLVESMESLESQFLGKLEHLESGTVTVAALRSVVTDMLPSVVVEFHTQHPRVELDLCACTSSEVLRRVSRHEMDLGIGSWPHEQITSADGHISFQPLTQREIRLVVPRGHPLTTLDRVSLEDVLEYPLVAPTDGSRLWHVLYEAIERRGIRPRISIRLVDSEERLLYVRAGVGVTFARVRRSPSQVARDLVWIALVDNLPPTIFGLLTRTDTRLSFWARRFADCVISSISDLPCHGPDKAAVTDLVFWDGSQVRVGAPLE